MYAIVTKYGNRDWRIEPWNLGLQSIVFKEKFEAELVAAAINTAYSKGKKELQGNLKELLDITDE